MSDTVIEAQGLTKRYGRAVAVNGISFTVGRGEIFGLLGPNGAGKTTTILMMLGLTEVTSGTVSLLGRNPVREPLEVKRQVGYLPDSVGFYDYMTAADNLRYTAALIGFDAAEREKRVLGALDRVGLTDVANQRVATYSRGMRQRLGLAEILMKDAQIAILDEPTSGLDPQATAELLEMIRSLKRDGVAVLISSHLLERVQSVCDRVIIISQGTIRWDGRLSRLAEQVPVVVMEVRGPADDVRRMIEGQAGVKKVNDRPLDDGVTLFEIEQERGQDLREPLGKRVIEKGYPIRRLDLRRKNLEALYTDVVLSRDAAAA